MNYTVTNMKLVVQDQSMSCWLASGQMLIHWRQRKTASSEIAHPDPALLKKWGKKYDDNAGITNNDIRSFANDLGLEIMPPMTPTPQYIHTLLNRHGPLWVNGRTHITVIAGIRDNNGAVEVLVFDPAIASLPNGKWHKYYDHYGLQPHTQTDSGTFSITSMLFLPTE